MLNWSRVRQLKSKEPRTRARAAAKLGRSGVTREADRLVEMLRDPSQQVRDAAEGALQRLGWPSPERVEQIERAMAHLRFDDVEEEGEAAVGPLLRGLKSDGWRVRREAARILGANGSLRAVGALGTVLLSDDDWRVRSEAAAALGFMSESCVLPVLRQALSDGSQHVRRDIVEALSIAVGGPDRVENRHALRAIVSSLEDPSIRVRQAAFDELEEIADEEDDLPDDEIRQTAADAVGSSERPDADSSLDHSRWVRLPIPAGDLEGLHRSVCETLNVAVAAGPVWGAVTQLLELLMREDPRVRRIAARELGRRGDPWIIAPLLALALDGDDPAVVIPALEQLLEDCGSHADAPDLETIAGLADGAIDGRLSRLRELAGAELQSRSDRRQGSQRDPGIR